MSFLSSCSISMPQHQYGLDQLRASGKIWLRGNADCEVLFQRLLSSSNVQQRGFSIPLEKILTLSGLRERSQLFEELAPSLALPAIAGALKAAGKDPSTIDYFIFTSCSVPAIPSIDAVLVELAGFSPLVRRLPIFQHGCAGGMVGLELAHEFASNNRSVLLVSVELCSLLFHYEDVRTGQLVGGALFSDGAAAVVVTPDAGPIEILASSSCLLPDSRHLMGYELQDDGLHLLLDRDLPSALTDHIPKLTKTFLEKEGLTMDDVSWWLFHPGGPKILSSLQQALHLSDASCRFAGEVLSTHGNMSSATIFFVLNRFLSEHPAKSRELMVLCGVGPGLTVELILCRVNS